MAKKSKIQIREHEQLAKMIHEENVMLKRIKRVLHWETVIVVVFALFFVWGQFNLTDPFLPNISEGTKSIFKWIGLIGLIISGVIYALSILSYRNARKILLAKIDKFNEK
jgi:TRAP-type C4-dicarboxylate transport system permease small subunit